MFQKTKVVEEIKTQILYSIPFFNSCLLRKWCGKIW